MISLTIAGGMNSLYGVAGVTRQVIDVTERAGHSSLPLELKPTGCGGLEFELPED